MADSAAGPPPITPAAIAPSTLNAPTPTARVSRSAAASRSVEISISSGRPVTGFRAQASTAGERSASARRIPANLGASAPTVKNAGARRRCLRPHLSAPTVPSLPREPEGSRSARAALREPDAEPEGEQTEPPDQGQADRAHRDGGLVPTRLPLDARGEVRELALEPRGAELEHVQQ